MKAVQVPMYNKMPIDKFTALHLATGAVMGFMDISPWVTAMAAISFEYGEDTAKVVVPRIFPHPTPDTKRNALIDAAAVMLGWAAVQRFRD